MLPLLAMPPLPLAASQLACAFFLPPCRRLLLTLLISSPPKTMDTAAHCWGSSGLPFHSTCGQTSRVQKQGEHASSRH